MEWCSDKEEYEMKALEEKNEMVVEDGEGGGWKMEERHLYIYSLRYNKITKKRQRREEKKQ